MTTPNLILPPPLQDTGPLETMARALCRVGDDPPRYWSDYTEEAQAAITALTEAGYAIVPVAPSAEMIAAGSRHSHIAKGDDRGHAILRNLNAMTIYRDMIQASPSLNTKEGE